MRSSERNGFKVKVIIDEWATDDSYIFGYETRKICECCGAAEGKIVDSCVGFESVEMALNCGLYETAILTVGK